MVKNAKNEKTTLTAFIEDNHKLLSTLGIFIALTVFASSLTLRWIASILSGFFLFATILICFELWERFPSGGSTRLAFFENTLVFATLVVIAYWLLEFRTVWHLGLIVPIAVTFLWLISVGIKRFNVFDRLFRSEPGGRKVLRYIFGLALVTVVWVISTALAILITPPINAFLDATYEYLKSTAP